jgi:DNA repair protein RadA/Sms
MGGYILMFLMHATVSEIGIFEMRQDGLREISNPSEILISQHSDDVNGIAIAVTIEGLRPFLIETQSLVSPSVYGNPQRSSTGFDLRRLNMLLAVLEKKCGLKLNAKDVFLNITGGIHVDDPAADLAIVISILSSLFDVSIDAKSCFAGEIGLSGEIRPVSRIEQRILEAKKLGYKRIYISSFNPNNLNINGIEIIRIAKIEKFLTSLFSN